ncbi:hypothetical protein C8F01DRAFT_1279819 [Mycena amicta]|nr:hypothetical protein C8F01DRAFT_1279819 [Mycena amicta]
MKAHPLLTSPVLSVDFIRLRVSEDQINAALRATHLDATLALIKPKRKRGFYRLEFPDLSSAEKALAILHLQPIPAVEPPVVLELSINPPRPKPVPVDEPTAAPRVIRAWGESAEMLFDALRPYGPLHSIRCDPIAGALVQFWFEDDAKEAAIPGKSAGKKKILDMYDPCTVFCSNVHFDIEATNLRSYFEKYGTITRTEILRNTRTGKSRGMALISFLSNAESSAAIRDMHGQELHWRKISMSYGLVKGDNVHQATTINHPEPELHKPFEILVETATTQALPSKAEYRCAELDHLQSLYDQVKQQLEEERLRREFSDSECTNHKARYDEEVKLRVAAEAEIKQLVEVERLRRALEVSELAKLQVRCDEEGKLRVESERLRRELESEGAKRLTELATVQAQCINEIEKRAKAVAEAKQLRAEKEAVERVLELAQSKLKMLELERDKPIWEEAKRKREEAEAAQRRAEDIATRIKNFESMLAQEKAKKGAERQERLRRERVEKERQEKEEKARLAREREERERKAQEERERLQRLQRWQLATAKEVKRCKKRDTELRGTGKWTVSMALSRVKLLMLEFDKLKFSETQPLTLSAVPWPILTDPLELAVEDISWDAVEKFFKKIKLGLWEEPAEYKALVERLHRMFHPDKWRSRAILATVLDDGVRTGIEAAGNTVAQALTPLWRESKGYA